MRYCQSGQPHQESHSPGNYKRLRTTSSSRYFLSMSVYNKAVTKKLTFKGQSDNNKKPKQKRKLDESGLGSDAAIALESQRSEDEIVIMSGTGTTVHGHGTNFMEELQPGDAILISHPTTMRDETKIVKMVLSGISIGISSAFSTDLITTTTFKYIKAPKDQTDEQLDKEKQKGSKKRDVEEEAYGTYASNGGQRLTYREKKPGAYGGYKIVHQETEKTMTREELLDQRSKKKALLLTGDDEVWSSRDVAMVNLENLVNQQGTGICGGQKDKEWVAWYSV
eukprot:gene8215-16890_t